MKFVLFVAVLTFLGFLTLVSGRHFPPPTEETPEMLRATVRADLERAKRIKRNNGMAQNLILVIGDGMGMSTVATARIYIGQKKGQSGEENKLVFEDFPSVGLSKTYTVDRQVTDSAAGAGAMLSGLKVNYGTMGVNAEVPYGKNCSYVTEERKILTMVDYALAAGKSVGVVTNTKITHATPGAAYAHTPYRDWESDTDMIGTTGCENVKDIAYQLVMDNNNINVVLGGGRRSFLPDNFTYPGEDQPNSHQRTDKLDLREIWKQKKEALNQKYSYVETTKQLMDVDVVNTDYLFGLFSQSHMSYEAYRDKGDNGQPSLTEMVDKALQILNKNDKGYFLLVEGGRIDHAHHDNFARLALEETEELERAVKTIMRQSSVEDTLLVATADHSHSFTFNGYATRGNDILGVVDDMFPGEEPTDKMPYLTLGYVNGPSGRTSQDRDNLTNVNTTSFDFAQPSDVKMDWETHGGEDVPIYSIGPMSHLFHTTHDQAYIGYVMMYAACIGEYSTADDCDTMERSQRQDKDISAGARPESTLLVLLSSAVVLMVGW